MVYQIVVEEIPPRRPREAYVTRGERCSRNDRSERSEGDDWTVLDTAYTRIEIGSSQIDQNNKISGEESQATEAVAKRISVGRGGRGMMG